MKKLLFLLIFAILGLSAGTALHVQSQWNKASANNEGLLIEIPRGSSPHAIGRILQQKKLVAVLVRNRRIINVLHKSLVYFQFLLQSGMHFLGKLFCKGNANRFFVGNNPKKNSSQNQDSNNEPGYGQFFLRSLHAKNKGKKVF